MSQARDENRLQVPPWLWPNVFGLDAAVVAVAWQHFFAIAFKIKIPAVQYLTLGLVVLAVYSLDRLLDARRLGKPDAAALRHRFYRRHFRLLALLTGLVAAVALWLVLSELPGTILLPGFALSMLVALYYVHRVCAVGPILVLIPKEVFSGLVFAMGATLIGFTLSHQIREGIGSVEVFCFGTLCAVNCLAISVWERDQDAGNDKNAIAQLWPGSAKFLPGFAVVVTLLVAVLAFLNRREMGFPLILGAGLGLLLIALLSAVAGRMRPAALRVLADVAVLVPALALLPIAPWVSTG